MAQLNAPLDETHEQCLAARAEIRRAFKELSVNVCCWEPLAMPQRATERPQKKASVHSTLPGEPMHTPYLDEFERPQSWLR